MGDVRPPRLLERVRNAARVRHYSRRTEQAYVQWIRRYVRFHGTHHPAEMGEDELAAFLTGLATRGHVSASTQNQALSALLFLYRDVLGRRVDWLSSWARAKRPGRVPVVLTRDEVRAVHAKLTGEKWLVASLLYGAGLRLLEALTLRVKDLDFERREIRVRRGKGGQDRVTMLPQTVMPALRAHLEGVRRQHERDLASGGGRVSLPDAMDRKYPAASREWGWQWVFPAHRPYSDPVTREPRRHHLHPTVIQRAFHEAVLAAEIHKHAPPQQHLAPGAPAVRCGRESGPRRPRRS